MYTLPNFHISTLTLCEINWCNLLDALRETTSECHPDTSYTRHLNFHLSKYISSADDLTVSCQLVQVHKLIRPHHQTATGRPSYIRQFFPKWDQGTIRVTIEQQNSDISKFHTIIANFTLFCGFHCIAQENYGVAKRNIWYKDFIAN